MSIITDFIYDLFHLPSLVTFIQGRKKVTFPEMIFLRRLSFDSFY